MKMVLADSNRRVGVSTSWLLTRQKTRMLFRWAKCTAQPMGTTKIRRLSQLEVSRPHNAFASVLPGIQPAQGKPVLVSIIKADMLLTAIILLSTMAFLYLLAQVSGITL